MVDILRPLDEVQIHGEVTLSPTQYDTIITEVAKGTNRSKNSRKVFHFLSSHAVLHGVNTVHLDVMQLASRRGAHTGDRILFVSLAQEWFPNARNERVPSESQSAKHAPRIEAILDSLMTHSPPTDLTCHVDWMFREDEAEPVIPIPFPLTPMPLPSELDMPTVRGLRIASEDNTRVASLERRPNGRLLVSVTFRLSDTTFGMVGLERAMQKGDSMCSGLVHARPKERG